MTDRNEQMRAEFEAWVRETNKAEGLDDDHATLLLQRAPETHGRYYIVVRIESAWKGWQAARRQHGSAAQAVAPIGFIRAATSEELTADFVPDLPYSIFPPAHAKSRDAEVPVYLTAPPSVSERPVADAEGVKDERDAMADLRKAERSLSFLCDLLPAEFMWGDSLQADALDEILDRYDSALSRPAAAPEEANLAGFIAEIEAQPGGKEEVAAARQWARDYIAAEVAAEQPTAEPELPPIAPEVRRYLYSRLIMLDGKESKIVDKVFTQIEAEMRIYARAHLRAAWPALARLRLAFRAAQYHQIERGLGDIYILSFGFEAREAAEAALRQVADAPDPT